MLYVSTSSWAADHGEEQKLHNCGVFCQMAQVSRGMGGLHASQSQDTFANILHGSGSRWLFVVEFPRLNLFRAINVDKTLRQVTVLVSLWLTPPTSATEAGRALFSEPGYLQGHMLASSESHLPPKSLSLTGSALPFVPGRVPGTFQQAASTKFIYLPHLC